MNVLVHLHGSVCVWKCVCLEMEEDRSSLLVQIGSIRKSANPKKTDIK